MAITKAKKGEILEKLSEDLKNAESVVFVNFHGLPVGETTVFRKNLREGDIGYYVAKKTLIKRVLAEKKFSGTQPELAGELALAWSSDPMAAAKGVFEFAKTHKEQVTLLGGVYQGAYMSREEITALASIPSREVLLGQFVGMLNESIAKVVRVIDVKARQMEGATA